MRRLLITITSLLMLISQQNIAQTETNVAELLRLAKEHRAKWNADRIEVLNYSQENNIPVRIEDRTETLEMQYIDQFGFPVYYKTENKNAAATISTNKVNSGGGSGYSLDGSGMTLHEWDGGGVLLTHQEFNSRVTMGDATSGTHYHSTHVAGTMVAAGVDGAAKGMAPSAELEAYDWNSDNAEMATAAAAGALVSNHSYGMIRGWYTSDGSTWTWYGTTSISNVEDYLFGFYDSNAAAWDEIAYNAPDFLICKSAGNDRGDGPGTDPATAEVDGGTDGFDCIGSQGVAKNILTVGAINDIPGGYTQPSDVTMSSFSCWGPTDDGRIKPDVVANGVGVYSTYDGNNTEYNSISGTSMATPNASGSLILLQEHYDDLNGGFMRSATLKALVIHTADEAGSNDGPDYVYGWGLINIDKAVTKITEDQTNDVIIQQSLANGGTYTETLTATSGYPIKVTIVWTDKKGTPTSAQLNPSTSMLVNDLDLRVEDQAARTVHYPWKLDKNNPANAATNTVENNIDNVEVVYIESPTPGETYTITVDHDGSMPGGQAFSMIISGYPTPPEANFSASKNSCSINETVTLTDLSTENPTGWNWAITPANYTFVNSTSASSQNPQVQFTATGIYDISLTASNASGNDTETKTGFISASDAPTTYCIAYSTNPAGIIENFSFASVSNNNTGYTNIGGADPDDEYYQDFTAILIDVNQGQTYSLYVLNGYDGTGEDQLDLAVWIDFNRDGDFDDTGEQVVCDIDDYGEGTFSVSIPGNASLGGTRMRLRTKYSGSDCGSPCGSTGNGEVEDYTLNIQPAPALPPVTEFSADDITPALDATVNFTDLSSNAPTSWLWSFDPTTVTYVGGTSATSQNPQVEFNATGTYDVTLYAENTHGNDTEIKSNYISVSAISYCAASGGGDEYISDFQLNTINNTGTTSDGYHDYTSLSTDLELLGTYSISITNATTYTDDDLGVWADWNQDGDFDDSGENIVCEVDDDGQGTFNITVPATANLGPTTIRARVKYNDADCGSPCGTTEYGEVEDYTINIKAGTLTWDGSTSIDWNDPDNWDGGVVPTSSFDVIIPDAASVPNSPSINVGVTATCANLTLETGATLNCDGDLTLTGTP